MSSENTTPEPLRLYADQLRGLAATLDEMPTALRHIPGFNEHSWIDANGFQIMDAGVTRPVSIHFDHEAENWYVEVGDKPE